jgi:small multidrug resistance pump
MSGAGIVGNYLLKRASEQDNPLASPAFLVGLMLYASTAFAWLYVMRHLKLATLGIVYSVLMVLLLAGLGVVFFGESLSCLELAGIALATAVSCYLLGSMNCGSSGGAAPRLAGTR